MARPVDDEKRLEIAEAAVAVLRERGVHETSMSKLAKALGMKRPTLYWYFSDLPSIFEHYQRHVLMQSAAYVAERLQGLDHPLDVLETWMRAEHAFYRERGLDETLLLLSQFWGASPRGRERFARLTLEQMEPLRALMIGMIAQGVADGRVGPCDPEHLVDFFMALLDGAVVHAVLRGVDFEALADFARVHVLDPLRLK